MLVSERQISVTKFAVKLALVRVCSFALLSDTILKIIKRGKYDDG